MPSHPPQPRTCWILSEGLAGTENQCLGVTDALAGVLSQPPEVKRIHLRAPWRQLSPWLRLGHGWAQSSAGDRLAPPWPDLVVASGRKTIGMARFLRRQSGGHCFTVVIQDPRVNPNAFDLVAVPQHDPTRGENVIVTTAGLHRVTPEKLAAAEALFAGRFDALPERRLAVLIGGNSRAHRMTTEATEQLCARLRHLHDHEGVALMVTASRRTGDRNMALLRKRLRGRHVDFWNGRGENPYFAFLATATHIVVTEDSVSMTSEALATGKPLFVAQMEGGGRRLDRFHRLLQDQGFTRPFAGRLETWSYTPPDDTQKVAERILHTYAETHEKRKGQKT